MYRVKCFSKGIKKIPFFSSFFPELSLVKGGENAVIGWGFKSTAKKARDYAMKHDLPYIALEDGFLRSVGLGVQGEPASSLVIDRLGIYYDSRQASELENYIRDADQLSEQDLTRASACMAAMRKYQLSKYNVVAQKPFDEKPKVLVIDQTQGDASVEGANACQQDFVAMLQAALDEHPSETIWLKVHPDVLCGKKKGFLYPLPFENARIKVCDANVNPWHLLAETTDLYTVSSLMGFEGLLVDVSVHCFGIPFYAGWGLTCDRQTCERRGVSRSLTQVFFAAYIQYSRYVDQATGKACEIEDVINQFADALRSAQVQPVSVNVSQLSFVRRQLLSGYFRAWNIQPDSASANTLVWGKKAACDNPVWRIEDGFIRSVGLGVNLAEPLSLVFDKTGIYFDATAPSDLENIFNHIELDAWETARARRLIDLLVTHNLTKYNVGQATGLALPSGQRIILVPGQVESDASLKFGSPRLQSNADLLAEVRKNNADAFIIYKPHPDVLAGHRDEKGELTLSWDDADQIVTDVNMSDLLTQVDEVHTMTSLTGFEALLRGKKVTTYGNPFYAHWGLTTDKDACPRRTRTLTLEALVFSCLILYPTYLLPQRKSICSVEQVIRYLTEQLVTGKKQRSGKLALLRFMKSIRDTVYS
ncbi:MAG: capsular polysaccharide biosynthesis protein [Flavobacteriales bacterium]|nr:capsular polysaccharide biosynthesis protein [Flavobacteriales bacterium]